MSQTNSDGIQSERCTSCGSVLRDWASEPMVSVRIKDLRDCLVMLVESDDPSKQAADAWIAMVRRLEQLIGQSYKQICCEPAEIERRQSRAERE